MNYLIFDNKKYNVTWDRLPDDYILPDDPVDNINQPLLASALTDALDFAGFIQPPMLIASNMGICAKVNGKTVLKAPDWFYVPQVLPFPSGVTRRSYTPYTEGDLPLIVMEFLSESESAEYSLKDTYPYGKMFFYEQILQVPIYVIFDGDTGFLEFRQLNSEGKYELSSPDINGRYYIEELGLFLGVWYGTRLNSTIYWLRWWDSSGNLLLWGSELVVKEKQRAETAEQQLAQLQELLKKAGINYDQFSD